MTLGTRTGGLLTIEHGLSSRHGRHHWRLAEGVEHVELCRVEVVHGRNARFLQLGHAWLTRHGIFEDARGNDGLAALGQLPTVFGLGQRRPRRHKLGLVKLASIGHAADHASAHANVDEELAVEVIWCSGAWHARAIRI